MKLLRTIRLDPSDSFVFARAAEPGEWAVSGSFLFAGADLEAMDPKERAAFRSGFLGAKTLGFSTLAIVTPIEPEERERLTEELAAAFLDRLGAPDMAAARAAAEEEIAFSASLAEHPDQTLIAVHRGVEEGEMKERFRTLTPRADASGVDAAKGGFRAFDLFEVEGDEEEAQEHELERADLVGLLQGASASAAAKDAT